MNKPFPRNFILRNPLRGVLLLVAFGLLFVILYKPFNLHGARSLSYAATMAVYLSASLAGVYALISVFKKFSFFSDQTEWTFYKELIFIFLVLSFQGFAIYFLGFIMEESSSRWNLGTFLSSYTIAFLMGLIPISVFTIANYRHLFANEVMKNYDISQTQTAEELLQISSTLKKEELSFYPSQFVYAESDGNYVIFYLENDNAVRKVVIRNSISNIEQQLAKIPFISRTHRAFIVNLKKVKSKKGNTLGYRLSVPGVDSVIPVSRQNIQHFDELMKQIS